MNSVVLTPMARGQITLPKKFRDKLGITSGTPLNVSMKKNLIIVKPISTAKDERIIIKPKYTPKEYLEVLKKISSYMKKNGPLWTEEDDKRRAESLKKEMEKAKRLNW